MALLLAVCLLAGNAAWAADKQALIIGNANYKNAAPLTTPGNDADDLAEAVKALGFEVTVVKDATGAQLREALQKFGERKVDFSVVYFGGHSIEFAGDHYLIPIDAAITSEATLRRDAVPLHVVTSTVARARALGLIVFDALRPNPFATKIERGDAAREAQVETAAPDGFRNVLQFFAVEAGKTAGDSRTAVEGSGRNSPLAAAILKYINEPHMEINFFFRNVRDEVRRSTQNKQTPFMYGQLSRTKFYINGTAEVAAARAVARDPAAVNACDTLAASPDDAERAKLVKGVRLSDIKPEAIAACQDAMKQFPGIARFPFQLGRAAYAAKDYETALLNYNRAFELGSDLALIAVATMYDEGIGTKKDSSRARFYYEVGVEKKSAAAMVGLGMQYERGAGVGVDLAKAYDLYKRAADLGHPRALYNVGLFNEKGIVVKANAKLAREMYEKSAAKGDDIAMLNLARVYANGIGGNKDMGKAKDWLTTAEQAGNDQARQILANMNKPKR